MAPHNVKDEIIRDDIATINFVLQLVDSTILEAGESEQKNATLNNGSSWAISEKQNIVMVQDDDLDEVAKTDIQVLKQKFGLIWWKERNL
ncbi:hypothetical protein TSUD_358520 [Trifolium subterraneum]|uniref:Uncharacterized protein n=1 Tax=Trifolium subterraneum TaxID=3900 RepID=A0A2Z6NAI4_TRISU|nr:hypothetical protein TSUD_358520 [Trifolium subterraneum]